MPSDPLLSTMITFKVQSVMLFLYWTAFHYLVWGKMKFMVLNLFYIIMFLDSSTILEKAAFKQHLVLENIKHQKLSIEKWKILLQFFLILGVKGQIVILWLNSLTCYITFYNMKGHAVLSLAPSYISLCSSLQAISTMAIIQVGTNDLAIQTTHLVSPISRMSATKTSAINDATTIATFLPCPPS